MADDIDIEEHDVMDNPVIRKLFPDLSVIKKEIEDYFTEDPRVKQSELYSIQKTTLKTELQCPGSTTDQRICHPDTQRNRSSTGDILFSHEQVIENPKTNTYPCNKIILGTKRSIKLNDNKNQNKSLSKSCKVKVVLEDINNYIKNSNAFCYDCNILFLKMDAFENHCNNLHSKPPNNADLIAPTCNICGNTFSSQGNLIRHLKNIHSTKLNRKKRKIVSDNNANAPTEMSSTESQSSCSHCDLVFPNKQSLVEHMYDVLQTKNVSMVDEVNINSKKLDILEQTPSLRKQNISKKDEINEDIGVKSLTETSFSKTEKCNKFYFCKICNKYFVDLKGYLRHMKVIHKQYSKLPAKRVAFNSNCRYCHINLSTLESYNKHVYRFHSKNLKKIIRNESLVETTPKNSLRNKRRDNKNKVPHRKLCRNEKECVPVQFKEQYIKTRAKKGITQKATKICEQVNHITSSRDISRELVLKSVLFKCSKCDIHFLSAHTAGNHLGHMEFLINWKCFVCQRIFKNQDRYLHEQQHLYSQIFTVHEVNDQESTSILFGCSKCNVHFTEENLKSHYETCKTETSESKHCIDCDVLVDDKTMEVHNKHHSKGTNIKLFVIEQNEILDIKITDINEEPLAVAEEATNKQLRVKKRNPYISFMYCSTCKCFLRNFKNGPHLKSECTNFKKVICRHCGLYFTATTMKVHKILHRKYKNLKLQDFFFKNLRTGKDILPPIPKYLKCEICGVYFVKSRELHLHLCKINEDKYSTCQVCGLKFSESAYKVHMPFHFYSLDGKRQVKKNRNQIVDVTYSTLDFDTLVSPGSEIDIAREDTSLQSPNKRKIVHSNYIDIQDPSYVNNIVYCCQKCNCAVLTYNKVVEHCHAHYNNENENVNKVKCIQCHYLFEYNEYSIHFKQHSNKKLITFQKYDIFYFASKNSEWTNHVLSGLEADTINAILENSIYRYEHKIKMEIIQNGPSDLSLYKCYICNSFVDPIKLHEHTILNCKINISKIRKHICSHCGLTFISSTYREKHESIHKRPNVTQKSFKIIVFNKTQDNEYNEALSRNVLYQCRNCDGIVDNKNYTYHKCNINDLTKCISCGLLLYADQYDAHVKKHKDYSSFNPNNMKVILIGDKVEGVKDSETMVNKLFSTYNGNLCDYTYYMCTKCKFCTKGKFNHTCLPSSNKYLCSICNLYFYKSNYHRKLHESDNDFIRENMSVIPFNPEKIDKSGERKDKVENKKNDEISTEAPHDTKIEKTDTIKEKRATIYKCNCGLHFLDASNIQPHLKQCGSVKLSKQVCSKCDLLFTPNVLFSHLLIHHGDKNCLYKYNIVEIEKQIT